MARTAKALIRCSAVPGALVLLLTFSLVQQAAEGPKPPTAEEVRGLQEKYRAERAAAEASGVAKKFAPDSLQRADQLARKGDALLAAEKLPEARDAFRRARWQLPALPAEFPEHVA